MFITTLGMNYSPHFTDEEKKKRPREVICPIYVLRDSKSQRLIRPVFFPLRLICHFSGEFPSTQISEVLLSKLSCEK